MSESLRACQDLQLVRFPMSWTIWMPCVHLLSVVIKVVLVQPMMTAFFARYSVPDRTPRQVTKRPQYHFNPQCPVNYKHFTLLDSIKSREM
mmetsp:Transcript_27709/g.49128  ORF Transcript_27709/g.49128 Transcript_27709/m.49128 type:complete len:91 (+) Transcript_27709:838-1110(+)